MNAAQEYADFDETLAYAGAGYEALSRALRALGIEPVKVEGREGHLYYPWEARSRVIARANGVEPHQAELFDAEPATAPSSEPAAEPSSTPADTPAADQPDNAAVTELAGKKRRSRRVGQKPVEFVPPVDPEVEASELAQLPRLRLLELCEEEKLTGFSVRASRQRLASLVIASLNERRAKGEKVSLEEWFKASGITPESAPKLSLVTNFSDGPDAG